MKRLFLRGLCAAALATIGLAGQASGSSHCPADINNNGIVNVDDLSMVLAQWSSAGTADIMGPSGYGVANGIIDVDDLLAIISHWGQCPPPPPPSPVNAVSLWCEDFELGNFSRWTGGYVANWSPCTATAFNSSKFVTPTKSYRSVITCTSANSHRGYGGLRFQGDNMVANFSTPSSGGIDAPHGLAVTFWTWLDVAYTFSPTQWLSLLTVTDNCTNDWTGVVTVNLDDSTMRLKPVHVSNYSYVPNAPSFPLQQWTRTTVYLNYYTGFLYVWQDGAPIVSANFTRPSNKMCQWHWGLYASGNNSNIVMYEDDIRIVKLLQPWTNFSVEPYFPTLPMACQQPPG